MYLHHTSSQMLEWAMKPSVCVCDSRGAGEVDGAWCVPVCTGVLLPPGIIGQLLVVPKPKPASHQQPPGPTRPSMEQEFPIKGNLPR